MPSQTLKGSDSKNGFSRYKQVILYRLDRLDKVIAENEKSQRSFEERVLRELSNLRTDVAAITGREKGRAGLWGGISGAAVVAATLIAGWLKGASS